MEDPLTTILKRKKEYPQLDTLISTEAMRNHIVKNQISDSIQPLTIGICLLHGYYDPPFSFDKILEYLEKNLVLFLPRLSPDEKTSLATKLLNGSGQFLNTLSELSIARYYFDQAWQIELEKRLPISKDVDVYARNSTEERWLEVLNAASKEFSNCTFISSFPSDLKWRLQDKVIEKFNKKFGKEIEGGWNGKPWIALDITKNPDVACWITMQQTIGKLNLDPFVVEVLKQCPELEGIVYYSCGADYRVRWLKEMRRP